MYTILFGRQYHPELTFSIKWQRNYGKCWGNNRKKREKCFVFAGLIGIPYQNVFAMSQELATAVHTKRAI